LGRTYRFVALGLVLAAGCGKEGPPTGFGVNLTVTLDAASRAGASMVAIEVTGDESYSTSIPLDGFDGDTARVHYVPSVTSGTLRFLGQAQSVGGAVIGTGASDPITLVAGSAVPATLAIVAGTPLDMATPPAADLTTLAKGDACTAGGAPCGSGLFCADGVCCDTACTDACSACNLPGKLGTCSLLAAGSMPLAGHADCGPDAKSTCMRDGTCDAAGACHKWGLGTVCKPSACDSSSNKFTPQSTCDGSGVCSTPSQITCDPYKCQDTSICFPSCTSSTMCSGTKSCVSGSCGLKSNGATCAAASECKSGFCADTVCCDTACTGTCTTCNQSATLGTCTAVPAGQDPKSACPAGAAENAICSPGGCDGTAGSSCKKAATTVNCRAGSCAAGTAVNPALCKSDGTCPAITTTVCSPYVCGATACDTTCSGSAPCVTGYYCDATSHCHVLKTPGTTCGGNGECASNICTDSVCCKTACGGCNACNLSGSAGTCTPVASGADPHAVCSAKTGADAVCSPGGCNGAGSCKVAPTTTQCRAPSCASGTQNDPEFCQSDGTCAAAHTSPCTPYTCGATLCNTSCTTSAQCIAGDFCNVIGKCQPKVANGGLCTAAADCTSGNCVDHVCCSTASCSTCQMCSTGGSCATTSDVPDFDTCYGNGANSCDFNGTCLLEVGQACTTASQCMTSMCCGGCGNGTSPCSSTKLWQLVGDIGGLKTPSPGYDYTYVAGLSNSIYIANDSSSDQTMYPHFFVSFDVTANVFTMLFPTPYDFSVNTPFCNCGFGGTLVPGPTALYLNSNQLFQWTPGSVKWTNPANNIMQRGESAYAVLNGKLYIMGGRDNSNNYGTLMQSWDLNTGATVSSGLSSLPFAVQDGVAGVAAGRIYLFGGYAPGVGSNQQMAVYDPGANNWSPLPNTPFTAANTVTATVSSGAKFVVFAGSSVWIYIPLAAGWTQIAAPPDLYSSAGVATAGPGAGLFLAGDTYAGVGVWKYVGPAL
jgi:hypothetical protein